MPSADQPRSGSGGGGDALGGPAAKALALVTDAGGTTYDVSLVRRGRIPWTRETMVGDPTYGYITGFPAVDVRSIGANSLR